MIWQPIRDTRQFCSSDYRGMSLGWMYFRHLSLEHMTQGFWRIHVSSPVSYAYNVLSFALFLCRNSCECLKKGDAERSKVAKEAKQYKVPVWHFYTLQMLHVCLGKFLLQYSNMLWNIRHVSTLCNACYNKSIATERSFQGMSWKTIFHVAFELLKLRHIYCKKSCPV